MSNIRKEAISRSTHWWYCDNVLNQSGKFGLLKMDFPQCFILIRDDEKALFCDFDGFRDHVAELNFFNPADRKEADVEGILIDAYNFMILSEEEEERIAEEMAEYDEEDDF